MGNRSYAENTAKEAFGIVQLWFQNAWYDGHVRFAIENFEEVEIVPTEQKAKYICG
jgi:hypothetical protein